MNLFDVYPLFDINIVKGKGCHVWDDKGTEYLDLYGGHAVISIGHAHPHYVEMISKQVATLGFYSNSVINKLQQQVAERLGKVVLRKAGVSRFRDLPVPMRSFDWKSERRCDRCKSGVVRLSTDN